eukprot:4579802-Pyramimonas_sp.AAC.1
MPSGSPDCCGALFAESLLVRLSLGSTDGPGGRWVGFVVPVARFDSTLAVRSALRVVLPVRGPVWSAHSVPPSHSR